MFEIMINKKEEKGDIELKITKTLLIVIIGLFLSGMSLILVGFLF